MRRVREEENSSSAWVSDSGPGLIPIPFCIMNAIDIAWVVMRISLEDFVLMRKGFRGCRK